MVMSRPGTKAYEPKPSSMGGLAKRRTSIPAADRGASTTPAKGNFARPWVRMQEEGDQMGAVILRRPPKKVA